MRVRVGYGPAGSPKAMAGDRKPTDGARGGDVVGPPGEGEGEGEGEGSKPTDGARGDVVGPLAARGRG